MSAGSRAISANNEVSKLSILYRDLQNKFLKKQNLYHRMVAKRSENNKSGGNGLPPRATPMKSEKNLQEPAAVQELRNLLLKASKLQSKLK